MPRTPRQPAVALEDALRLSGPLSFDLMVKPAGSLCNLGCYYCYYLDKAELYGGREPRMTEEMLRTVIRSYLEAVEVPEVTFNWHGGEPLVMGKDFYRKALAFEREYAAGRRVLNTLQTNGTLLDGEWCDIFREGNFLVGVSLDGPASVHDRYRKDRGGRGTLDQVLRGVRLLREHGVEFNTLTAVSKASEGRGKEIYRFLKACGSRYLQFNPVVEVVLGGRIVPPGTEGARRGGWSVSADGFGQFLCDIFDEWVRQDVGKVFVGQFDAALSSWCGARPGICAQGETCGAHAVVEHNGDVYSCDHFVYPAYRLGNLLETPLREMMGSERQVRFDLGKQQSLPPACLQCRWRFACNGECPQHRDASGQSALCAGYRRFFAHVAPSMERMRALLARGLPPALIMNPVG